MCVLDDGPKKCVLTVGALPRQCTVIDAAAV